MSADAGAARGHASVPPGWAWAAIAVSAALAVAGAWAGDATALHYLFKPLTTLLIAACLWRHRDRAEVGYGHRLLAGLLLSTVGDIALMFPGDASFMTGLGAFLLAHLAYWSAFRRRLASAPGRGPLWPWLVYAAVAAVVLAILWPHLPDALRVPVLAYIAVLVAMAATAAQVWRRHRGGAGFAALGGLSFVVSDASLALDRFVAPLPAAALVVLASYWLAQALIARSGMPAGGAD